MRDSSSDPPRETGKSSDSSGLFPHTRWTLISDVRQESDLELKERALSELCRIYWYPIYVFLRKKGCSPEDSEDLTQELFARMLRNEAFAAADQDRGRLRTYLLTSASRLIAEQWRRDTAKKRGGQTIVLSIEAELSEEHYQNEPATEISPETLFDKRWALALLKEVELRLQKDYEKRGKGELFHALSPFLAGKSPKDDSVSYAEIARTLGMSVPALKLKMHRMREKFRETVREEIAATLTNSEDLEEEMQHLYAALR